MEGGLDFIFLDTEIFPFVKGCYYFNSDDQETQEGDWAPEFHARAVVESQFLLVYLHSLTIGFHTRGILATGGASQNKAIVQVLSNIFGVPVFVSDSAKSAALGAAYRAVHGWHCFTKDSFVPFRDVVGEIEYNTKTDPDPLAHEVYQNLLPRYRLLLEKVTASASQ